MQGRSPRAFPWIIGLACVTIMSACGVSGASSHRSSEQTTHTMNGSVVLTNTTGAESACDTVGTGYADIASGTQVVVKNASGTMIGTGTLGSGASELDGAECDFSFTVGGLPNSSFYSVAVGGPQRGALTYSESELNSDSWTITLTLGS